MKYIKLFENYSSIEPIEAIEPDKSEFYMNKLREQIIQLQSQWLLQRNDELFTQLQYKQTLIHSIANDLELNEKDLSELKQLEEIV